MATKTDAPEQDAPALDTDALAPFVVSTARDPFVIADDAIRAPVSAAGADAYVTRAARAGAGTPVLLLVTGRSKPQAIDLSAIGAAITHGAITRVELDALLKLAG